MFSITFSVLTSFAFFSADGPHDANANIAAKTNNNDNFFIINWFFMVEYNKSTNIYYKSMHYAVFIKGTYFVFQQTKHVNY
ncbi:MAG TPA: hypothetical protein DG754_07855 [Bacteroidales bacterium]|nr:hypothetical protein [Bacteroidales bacterium]